MHPPTTIPDRAPSPDRRGRAWATRAIVLATAAALFAALAWHQRRLEREALRSPINDHPMAGSPVGPPEFPATAEVARAVRSLKLVTVEIDTTVWCESADRGWRGDVVARVEAPARLVYATDLASLDAARVWVSPVSGVYTLRVPRPSRVATEVFAERERASVSTGWLRLRSRAGEYHLGLARKRLGEHARAMSLTHEDAIKVAEATRAQVREMARKVIGDGPAIIVVFDDEPLAEGALARDSTPEASP